MGILDTYSSIRNKCCLFTDIVIAVVIYFLVYPQSQRIFKEQSASELKEELTTLKQEINAKFTLLETLPNFVQDTREQLMNDIFAKVIGHLNSSNIGSNDKIQSEYLQAVVDVRKVLKYTDEARESFKVLEESVATKDMQMKERVSDLQKNLENRLKEFEYELTNLLQYQRKLEESVKDEVAKAKDECRNQVDALKAKVDGISNREAIVKYDVETVWMLLIIMVVVTIIIVVLLVVIRKQQS